MSLRTRIGILLGLGVAGVTLFAANAQSEYLLVPPVWEPLARVVYRIAYFVILPGRVLILPVLPQEDHHWSATHIVVASLITPYVYYFGVRLLSRMYHRIREPLGFAPENSKAKVSRREFLVASGAEGLGLAAASAGAYSVLWAPQRVAVRKYAVPLRGLHNDFDGLRIVQLSDTHYGPFVSLDYLGDVIAQTNALKPDLVLLTGDYVHRSNKAIEPGIHLFSELDAPLGAVAVMGNHEHWEDVNRCQRAFRTIGLPVIDNHRRFLTTKGLQPTLDAAAICIGGVGDLWEDDVLIRAAFRNVPEDMPRILLSHNPDVAELIPAETRVDVMFSGHTHGGQVSIPGVGPPILPSRYGQKYAGGWCVGPRSPVIVSRGVGMAGLPIRFRVPPEISLVELRCV